MNTFTSVRACPACPDAGREPTGGSTRGASTPVPPRRSEGLSASVQPDTFAQSTLSAANPSDACPEPLTSVRGNWDRGVRTSVLSTRRLILVLLVRLLAEYAGRRWGFMTPAQVAEKFSAESVAEWLDDFRQWMRDYPVTEKFTNEIVTTLQQLH